jgi:hypothetical protein
MRTEIINYDSDLASHTPTAQEQKDCVSNDWAINILIPRTPYEYFDVLAGTP